MLLLMLMLMVLSSYASTNIKRTSLLTLRPSEYAYLVSLCVCLTPIRDIQPIIPKRSRSEERAGYRRRGNPNQKTRWLSLRKCLSASHRTRSHHRECLDLPTKPCQPTARYTMPPPQGTRNQPLPKMSTSFRSPWHKSAYPWWTTVQSGAFPARTGPVATWL